MGCGGGGTAAPGCGPAGGARTGPGWGGTRTDLVTSSSQRSASEGVRRWEGRAGEEPGPPRAAVADVDQSLPVREDRTHQEGSGGSPYQNISYQQV